MDYKQSGVDAERERQLIENIQQGRGASQANVLGGIGGFAALYALGGYKQPVLVSGADGVGTKLKLALDFGIYYGIGQDCVAMCVNDVLCSGARPLFFLDYLACDKLDVAIATALVDSVAAACAKIDIPLIGGETAQMPGVYRRSQYDLAGFCVGAVEQEQIRGRERTRNGDLIVGLSSNGLHSNGFSLVRQILRQCEQSYGVLDYDAPLLPAQGGMRSLKDLLLQPTTIYAPLVAELLQSEWGSGIRAMAHITGGGIAQNLPRALGLGLGAEIVQERIQTPPIFDFLQYPGKYLAAGDTGAEGPALVSEQEMWQTFNMGLGFALIVAESAAEGILQLCRRYSELGQELIADDGLAARVIGRVCLHTEPESPAVRFVSDLA